VNNNHYSLDLTVEGRVANLYTFTVNNDEKSELSKFVYNFPHPNDETFQDAIYYLTKDGPDRFGFPKNKFEVRTSRLSDPIVKYKKYDIRIFCIWFSKNLIIAGGGGLKTPGTRTTQENEELYYHLQLMQDLSKKIDEALRDGSLKHDTENYVLDDGGYCIG